ncbi:hypothetical protein [Vulcanisaeta distributa]|uniref:hypothetical protein n=1 Tax=Vulcanisaeta distributa TaxID=164451 RepID=UPI000AA393C6|nr:hypothetical protein [Vulcanisaeta distributa]
MNINNCVSVKWQLRANDNKGSFGSKAVVAEDVSKLGDGDFMTFLLFAILGDGDISVRWKSIRLVMGESKREVWGEVIKRLEGLGFKERKRKHKITYVVKSSKAAELAKKMLDNPPSIKASIEDLALLPDAEKLKRLTTLTNMKSEPKGKSSVEVAGIKMTVSVNGVGHIELRVTRRDYEEARAILERLRGGADYGEVELSKRGNYFVVYMGINTIKKYPELVTKVCEVLRRMLEGGRLARARKGG